LDTSIIQTLSSSVFQLQNYYKGIFDAENQKKLEEARRQEAKKAKKQEKKEKAAAMKK
jgi:hypothetical protein